MLLHRPDGCILGAGVAGVVFLYTPSNHSGCGPRNGEPWKWRTLGLVNPTLTRKCGMSRRRAMGVGLRASSARCAGKSSVQTRRRNVSCSQDQTSRYLADLRIPERQHLRSATRRFFGGSTMPVQHTQPTGFLCGWPVALELSTRQLEIRILAGTGLV